MPITLSLADTRQFQENAVNAAPALLDPGASFAASSFNDVRIVITGLAAADRVGLKLAATADNPAFFHNFSGDSFIGYGSADVGVLSGGAGTDLVLQFFNHPGLGAAIIQDVLRALTYATISDAPAAVRTLTVSVDEGGNPAVSETVQVTVVAENDAPVVTSGASAVAVENSTGIVYQAMATDPEGGALGWTLSGMDAARFTIDPVTGAVRFAAAPDFEAPGDADRDNAYAIIVSASDGSLSDSRAVTVTVTDLDEPPGLILPLTVAENLSAPVFVPTASDPEGNPITYSLAGQDAALFRLVGTGGTVEFIAPPDFETPRDADGDNIYRVDLVASDRSASSRLGLAVRVTDVNEAPVLGLIINPLVFENHVGPLIGVGARDPEGGALTYSLFGADADRFSIDTAGTISFVAPPDFEHPVDADGNNQYEFTAAVSDGLFVVTRSLSLLVLNVNEPPRFSLAVGVLENLEGPLPVPQLVDPEGGAFTLTLDGPDAALFVADATGGIRFRAAPDFEAPGDAGANNRYDLGVALRQGATLLAFDLRVTVSDDPELPLVSTGTGAAETMRGGTGDDALAGLAGADQLDGGRGDDSLAGGGGADTLIGGVGNDTLAGAAGDDVLQGGLGADLLVGGKDADAFRYASAAEGDDTIRNFAAIDDRIEISAAGFGGGLVAGGPFAFMANTSGLADAPPATGQFIWERDARTLWWDVDGMGGADAAIIARFLHIVGGASGLSASDIVVIA